MSARPKRQAKKPSKLGSYDDSDSSAGEGTKKVTKKVPVSKKKTISKKSTKKGKPAKDPNKPKRGKTGYIFFTQEARRKVQDENPGLGFGQITKLVSQQWKEMSEEEKKPFLKKAQEDKERYDKELKNYKNKKSDDDAGSAEDGSEDEEDSD